MPDTPDTQSLDKALQERTAELLGLLSAISEIAVITDRDGRILEINELALLRLGGDRSKVVGSTIFELVDEETARIRRARHTELLATGQPLEYDDSRLGRTFHTRLVPIRNEEGQIFRLAVFTRETTPWIKAQEDLRSMNEALERSNQELQQFAHIVSHDLQEPLRMVSSFVQLLAERYRGRIDAEADQYIRFAVDGSNRGQALVRDLLRFSRVGQVRDAAADVDLNEVLRDVLSDLFQVIRETHATVDIAPLPIVRGHRSELGQLFRNLLDNALKFQDGTPKVKVWAEDKGGAWLFAVKDNGIGIPPEARERLFGVFQRLHNRKRFGGSGLGLAICKKTVEAYGGKIWVESKENDGSIFYFSIPKTYQRR